MKTSSKSAWALVAISLVAGLVISVLWSAALVDGDIGDPVANSLLGFNAKEVPISGLLMGALFAFATGIAGTFTACNICAISAIAPMAATRRTLGSIFKPLGWMVLGVLVISALYGGIGALIGSNLPQLSSARLGDPVTGIPVRLVQSMVVFTSIGLIYMVWGLISLKILKNPFARFAATRPWLGPLFMGATIGAFLIGRPFPLFRKMFEYAAETHNAFYGAAVFMLQGLGNILLVVILFLLLFSATGGRFERWLTSDPGRAARVTGVALLIAGTFFVSYWGPRMLARNGLFVWPYMNWEAPALEFIRKS